MCQCRRPRRPWFHTCVGKEKEMAVHSRILAWRIPWKEEPGWLQSIGSQSLTGLKGLSTHARKSNGYHILAHSTHSAQALTVVSGLTKSASTLSIFSILKVHLTLLPKSAWHPTSLIGSQINCHHFKGDYLIYKGTSVTHHPLGFFFLILYLAL